MPAAARTRTAPLQPRRVSGPTKRPVPVGTPVRGRTGAFERVLRVPDHRVVDRVLRSRGIIWIIGILLGGIVAMQVSLLRLNTGISRAVQAQTTLVRQNASLEASIGRLSSADRVRDAAGDENMIDPNAGDNRYLTVHPVDAARAARRMKPPGALQKAIMANEGMVPGALSAPGTAGAAVAAALTGSTPVATATVVPQPTPTIPAPSVTPVATVAPVVAATV